MMQEDGGGQPAAALRLAGAVHLSHHPLSETASVLPSCLPDFSWLPAHASPEISAVSPVTGPCLTAGGNLRRGSVDGCGNSRALPSARNGLDWLEWWWLSPVHAYAIELAGALLIRHENWLSARQGVVRRHG
jgi:hypothetical protein